MTRNEVMTWLQDNIPEWPHDLSNCMNIPTGQWHWWRVAGCGIYVLNLDDGDFINESEFLTERWHQRLKPCGMSFKELMEDLNL